MADGKVSTWKPTALAVLVLAYLVIAVFHPITSFEFTNLDVVGQLVRNTHMHGISADNLKHMFTTWGYTSYYPVRSFSFALDYELWGLDARGYKLTNLILHLVNTLLVFWLICRLFRESNADLASSRPWRNAGVAIFAAAVFAVHPVVVEAVAWVPGREELLMTCGALICFHCHLTARRQRTAGAPRRVVWIWHALAVAGCLVASLSNVVAAAIPAMITAWDVLTLDRPKLRRIVSGTAGLWIVAMATIVMKLLSERKDPMEPQFGFLSWEQLVAMVKVYGWRIRPLVWPADFSISYYNVDTTSFLDLEFLFGAIAMAVTGLALWMLRRRTIVVFGLWWFVLSLGPVSQIVPHHTHRADRFLYLPLVGLAVVIAMLLRPVVAAVRHRLAVLGLTVLGLAVVFLLDAVSARQVQVWRNSITLWEHAIRLTPGSSLANQCLGDAWAEAGQFARAIPFYEMGLHIDPEDRATLNNYALRLAMCHQTELRDYELAIALARKGCEITQWEDPKLRRTLAIAYMNYATDLKQNGEFERAIESYDKALAADPTHEVPMFNLALLLASCSEPALQQTEEALRLADEALQLVEDPRAVQLAIAARVYVHAGRTNEGIQLMRRAIRKSESEGDAAFTAQLRAELRDLQDGRSPDAGSRKG